MRRAILACLWVVAAGELAAQEELFPHELGRRWRFEDDLGREVVMEVTDVWPDGAWQLATRGLLPDEAWPPAYLETHRSRDLGIQLVSTTGGGGRSSFGGEPPPLLLKAFATAGETWVGRKFLCARSAEGLDLFTTAAVDCRAEQPEQVAVLGSWRDALRVRWRTRDGSHVRAEGDAWYARGLGPVRTRLRIESAGGGRELVLRLKALEWDPTAPGRSCTTCGRSSVRAVSCDGRRTEDFVHPLGRRILDAVRDLAADDATLRDESEERLRGIGAPATAALRRAAEEGPLESRLRARRLLEASR